MPGTESCSRKITALAAIKNMVTGGMVGMWGRGHSRPRGADALAGYTPIAALIRARVSGSSRSRAPVASATALAIAAAVGP